ncbi:hypothetical protein BOX15_Mlig006804g1 [Macrostomum lignano]|uniref:Uncharacterized protein n=1 Tax=Macrostomum lignano TaxID=282301 RepID=A0A267ESC2_9PLAT|nr:hypothetical protein BOX15_Mlig006804g1 [Macrostomum lignano]
MICRATSQSARKLLPPLLVAMSLAIAAGMSVANDASFELPDDVDLLGESRLPKSHPEAEVANSVLTKLLQQGSSRYRFGKRSKHPFVAQAW